MVKRKVILVACVVCALVVALGVNFTLQGFTHIDARLELRSAGEHWQNGQVEPALRGTVTAVRMALESGVRWSIAGIYIHQMRSLEEKGQLQEALDQCLTVSEILDAYDDEGGLSYECAAIEGAIERSKPHDPPP